MKKEKDQSKPALNRGGCDVRGGKANSTLTMNQLKLSVAMELRLEGYGSIVFDKMVEVCGRRARIHVYYEDDVHVGEAVYCINNPRRVNPKEVFEVLEIIRTWLARNSIDCVVSLAFPLSLLPKVKALIGLTPKVYMVDEEGRVWIHHPWGNVRRTEISMDDPIIEEDEEYMENSDQFSAMNTQMRKQPYYVV